MWWQGGRRSENIEDRRGGSLPQGVRLGGMGGLGILNIAVVAMFLGIDPRVLFQGGPVNDSPDVSVPPSQSAREAPVGNDELRDFVSVVLADTEDTWQEVFQRMGRTYQPPTLVLFSDAVRSACGIAESTSGPF